MTEQEKTVVLTFGLLKEDREEVESARITEDRDEVNNYMDEEYIDKIRKSIREIRNELRESLNYDKLEENEYEDFCKEDNEKKKTIVEKISEIIESILNDENEEITKDTVKFINDLMNLQLKSMMIEKNA